MADVLEYQASDAEANFAGLLDQVERGRTVRITRDGKAIARLVPEEEVRRAKAAEAIERLKALRQEFGKAPLDEILASRHEGHKY
jgi:prevent-host-death family protein